MSARDQHILTTLEDLAQRRRHCTTTIVSLCAFYQVDPAPYLGGDVVVSNVSNIVNAPAADERRKMERRAKSKREKPPRPQRPASHATNGTGRAHKVSSEAPQAGTPAARILNALKSGPKSPGQLGALLGLTSTGAMYHVKGLNKAGHVTISGERAERRVSLPS